MHPDDAIPFIDTHHHLWDLSLYPYDWLAGEGTESETEYLGDYEGIRRDYLIEDLLRDYEGLNVAKSVHVQADFSGPDPVTETRWLQQISDEHGFPQAIVAYSDLTSHRVGAELDRHSEQANMRGIRMVADADTIQSIPFRRGLNELVKRDLSFDLFVDWEALDEILSLIRDFPTARFIVTHTGDPVERSPEYFQFWKAGIHELARNDNVAIKISGLGMRDQHWTVESIRPWVLETINAFGVARCMFGTNWPVDRLYSDLPALIAAYREIVSGFTREERGSLFWRNAQHHYRI